MASNSSLTIGISSAILAASAIVIQSGALWYFIRKFKKLQRQYDDVQCDYNTLRNELSILRVRINSLESQTKSNQQQTVRFVAAPILNEQPNNGYAQQPIQQPIISRVSSITSSSDYTDAYDEWPNDERAALITNTTQNNFVEEPTKNAFKMDFAEIDALHEKAEYSQTYDKLKKAYDSDPKNIEILWRLARACHNVANSFDPKDPKRKEKIIEGHKYATDAYDLDDNNFLVLKWCSVLTGSLTDHLGTKEKIEMGFKFKEYLNKGLAIDPAEYSLLHMRGRFSYSVANLSWFERKAASTFFAKPPEATIDDALTDFLEVEKVRPAKWIENLLYVGRCYIAKKNKSEAAKYLNQALAIAPEDDSDREALAEVKKLL